MWHEARRQERKIRVMMVDYQKRADRRRQFYEQIVCTDVDFCTWHCAAVVYCYKFDDIQLFSQYAGVSS